MSNPNMYEKLLADAQLERKRRQARRREEMNKYAPKLPTFVPRDDVKPPIEVREYLREKIRSLLND